MFDLAILGGQLVLETGVQKANVYVKGGKIAVITSEVLSAKENINANGQYVFPGAIDPHVHLNDPGLTDGEDFYTGTASSAAGGITTILEMPLTVPLTADKESFMIKRREAEKKSVVDYGLYLAMTPDNYDCLEELMELKPIAFKSFMSYSPEIPMVDDGHLYAGMQNLAKVGGRLALHCENNDIINFLSEKLQKENRKDPLAYLESRPGFAEWESIQRAVNFAKETGVQLHVVHSSTPEGATIVAEAQKQGYPISVETAPHFLLLNSQDFEEFGPYAQCNPPLREDANKEMLWKCIKNNLIDCIGSDHAPYTFEEKEVGIDNIWNSPAGVNGIQTMIPMTIGEGMERQIPLEKISDLIATNPAKIFGLYPRKGAIRIESDADLFLFNPNETWTVKRENLFYKQPWTPFENKVVKGRITRTIIRGTTVYVDAEPRGEIVVDPGFGEFLPGNPVGVKSSKVLI